MRYLRAAGLWLVVFLAIAGTANARSVSPIQEMYEPFIGTLGGDGWPTYLGRAAIPICIVNAESHGLVHEHSNPSGSSGKYQIEPGTWKAYGGTRWTTYAYQASELDQSIVASRIWNRGRGAHNWTTAASCGY